LLRNVPPYTVRVSRELSDPDWDRFVEATQGGTYQQSSMWAQVKSTVGWRPIRFTLSRDSRTVAGCQALVRSFARLGAVGFVPYGPLVAHDNPDAIQAVLSTVQRMVKEERLLYLKLQPPPDCSDMSGVVKERGFVPSSLDAAPRFTARVDLRQSPDALLAAMRPTTRYEIRRAERRGVVIRDGGEKDLPIFYEVVKATSSRQGFSPYPQSYFEQMWRSFHERGHIHLLIAEYQGEVLSSNLLVGFGKSTFYKMGGWSGVRRDIRPNPFLHWTGMQWGRQHGYRYYDFEGINPSVGDAIMAGRSGKDLPYHSIAFFKLGFGGEVTQFPGSYDYASQPLLQLALRWIAPKLDRLAPVAHSLLGRKKATPDVV
jgi:peptidoglycan pentaglycine glycine transferase (the first glycine)